MSALGRLHLHEKTRLRPLPSTTSLQIKPYMNTGCHDLIPKVMGSFSSVPEKRVTRLWDMNMVAPTLLVLPCLFCSLRDFSNASVCQTLALCYSLSWAVRGSWLLCWRWLLQLGTRKDSCEASPGLARNIGLQVHKHLGRARVAYVCLE